MQSLIDNAKTSEEGILLELSIQTYFRKKR